MLDFNRIVITVLACATVACLTLPLAALAHRWTVVTLPTAFNLLAASVVVAVLVLFGAVYVLMVALRRGLRPESTLAGSALLLSAVELLFIGFQAYRAFTLPMIHDITTDGVDVPEFDVAHDLRDAGDHALDYGSDRLPASDLWAMQRGAYPAIEPIRSKLDEGRAFDRALVVLNDAGLSIVNEDREAGRIEAVATTFWFGFKDDLVVRVRGAGDRVQVDLRSVSRLGQSDLGANAARIGAFIEAFGE